MGVLIIILCCLLKDLENWDSVGLNTPRPPDILHLYRNYGNHLIPQLVDEEKQQLLVSVYLIEL